jgi:Domain of unknown function (DUF5063)
MSEPPAQGGEWRPIADQIAANVKNFIDGVAALAQDGGDETVPMLLLEVSQILLAGAQLGASRDVILPGNWEPEVGDDPDLDAVRTGLARRLAACDEYAEVFDPYSDTSCLPFRISDDIAAVAADLIHGLKHYQAGRSLEALWWWQYSYFNHWGTHGGAALRALHAVVAHASLDVAEERTSLLRIHSSVQASLGRCAVRGAHRAEIWRLIGRRRGWHQAGRAADRGHPQGRRPGRGGRVRDG